jgi:hypothetical protein
MADFFKGLAGGFGTGLQFGQAMRQRRMEDDLAQEAGRYSVTEGAYGPGLQENIQQLQGLREQDPAQAPAYDQAIAELTRRQGLTAPDYSVASGPTNFATRQEARQAAAPMRSEGLAGVYRQYGDVAQADALEARAYEQQRALAREGREAQDFATRQAAAQQQGLLTGAKLTEVQRTQNLQAALDTRLADINKQEFEKPEQRTQAILSLVEELQGPQAAAQLRANYTQQELNDISLQSKKFEEGYRQSRAKGVFSAMEWFDEQNAAFKLERDPKNPFRVIQVNQDGSRQLFADAKNERELGMIVDAKAKPGGWLELAKYDLDLRKGEAAIEASKATTANARQEKLSPLEKNLAALKRLGVSVSPEEVKSMAGLKAPALSPEAAAQIEIITASLKDNSTPANIEAARTAVTDIFRGEGLKQRNTTIVNGLRTAAGRNDLPSAVKQLQDAGVANETIVGLARQAGVPIPAELLPPAPPPQTGLNTAAPRQPIQLLAPFNAIGDLRRRMQQEQQAADSSGGLVNPAGF